MLSLLQPKAPLSQIKLHAFTFLSIAHTIEKETWKRFFSFSKHAATVPRTPRVFRPKRALSTMGIGWVDWPAIVMSGNSRAGFTTAGRVTNKHVETLERDARSGKGVDFALQGEEDQGLFLAGG